MTYSFRPRGVCSQEMRVEVDDQGIISGWRFWVVAAAISRVSPPW